METLAPEFAGGITDFGSMQASGQAGQLAATQAGMAAPAEAGAGLWGAAGGMGAVPSYLYSGPAAAGYIAPTLLEAVIPDATENLGHLLGVGKIIGGEKEASAVGGALSGAAAGALTGAALTSWSGPGAIVGGVIGGVVGGVSSIIKGTWICTAIREYVGTTKQERASMRKLRKYAKKNYPGWLEVYNLNGPTLIEAIDWFEDDLEKFYGKLKDTFFRPCITLIENGEMENAFKFYKKKTIKLFRKYAPEVKIEEVS